MVRKENLARIRLEVRLSDRKHAKPDLELFQRFCDVSVRILRGRVTQRDARYVLEIFGNRKKINKILQRDRACGAAIQTTGADPASNA